MPSRYRPHFDVLEDRSCPASLLGVGLVGDTLFVTGTEGNDTITVRQIQNRITVDGIKGSLDAALVQHVVVDGRGGNDLIRLHKGEQFVRVDATVLGGAGDDTIVGGAAADSLVGG